MNEQNLDYLKTSLKFLGFGERLNAVLESAMKQDFATFKITLNNAVSPPGIEREDKAKHDHISYDVNFSKGKESDNYFLNSYKATLIRPGLPVREHTFNVPNQGAITAREAYNLLSGRAVNKDLPKDNSEKVNIWTKLDLDVKDARGNFPPRYFYPNYGYDLEKAISKYPLGDLTDVKRKGELLAALKKGDLFPAELMMQNKKSIVYVAAKPDMKGVDLYDKKMQTIRDYHIWPEQAKEKTQTSDMKNGSDVSDKQGKSSNLKIAQEAEITEKKGRGR